LDSLRQGLAVTTDALDAANGEAIATAARHHLRDPWSIPLQETPRAAAALMIDAPKRLEAGVRGESQIIRGGPLSRLARELRTAKLWGARLDTKTYIDVVNALLAAAADYQLVRSVSTAFDSEGWRLTANAVRLVPANGRRDGKPPNRYFVDLYRYLADTLANGGEALFGLDSREHTAQVDQDRREWREWRFRCGEEDRKKLAEKKEDLRRAGEPNVFLPALFCSPTMELGVDISALNAVYMRNMPPTPANYAQCSGRAGRSGQAALIVTYSAAQSPHDQYYFRDPPQMVSGVVRPPSLDLANRDLVEAHLHAVWLTEASYELEPNIPNVLDLTKSDLPVQEDIAAVFNASDLADRSARSMRRILDAIASELTATAAPWAVDREAFAAATARAVAQRFSDAFRRWRQLYEGARAQIALLERGTATQGADFYTYRYLATEGFLPGYNFPRLPLYAFIPSVSGGTGRAAYLQRARFLAISEFSPGSLIYHEGRAYLVYKAKLPPSEGGRLATSTIYVCKECGAAHDHERSCLIG
jgi:hypothetical protein